MESKKIYHVHLHEPYNGKQDYYFGSMLAIYRHLPADVVGIKYVSLKSRKWTQYENKKCVIISDEIKRSSNKDGET